jgi:hypothetical protein
MTWDSTLSSTPTLASTRSRGAGGVVAGAYASSEERSRPEVEPTVETAGLVEEQRSPPSLPLLVEVVA